MKRILITGYRSWSDRETIHEAIREHAIDQQTGAYHSVIHGDCKSGADAIARRYCEWLHLEDERHPADWNTFGKRAGFKRNAEMAAPGADLCLAFWDGESNGTKHMIEQCEKRGIPVKIIRENKSPK